MTKRKPKHKTLEPIVTERYYTDPGTNGRPVYMTCAGYNCPHDVWATFEKAEQHLLAGIREQLSKNQNMAMGMSIYMVWPDLNIKFVYTYWAKCEVKGNNLILKFERTPAVELKDGHQTGNYKSGTKEEKWEESPRSQLSFVCPESQLSLENCDGTSSVCP
jgi:hypothetical protein